MKILIIGGGPGGLYSGLLLKKNHPAFDVRIVERNPADATYGWGVVFSDRTLTSFREADPRTYEAITDRFVLWDAIDIRYRDRVVRSNGHSFAGMSRRELLNILQNRCRELDVRLEFEKELDDLSGLADYDLVVAADGVNSIVRRVYADAFQPDVQLGRARFIWLGTDKPFESFTFIFRENEHGLFQVHAYPFDGQTGTFIVECDEAVWQRAGLDKADEARSIAYCEALFAADLDGYRLLPNNSKWTQFPTVKNKHWRHQNIVLLGDSAHTAHFSIGSGTKLAMEDAIALARAFEKTSDLGAALNDYELERRPGVEALQAVAVQSQHYFENIKRYTHLDPMQFAFYLLTRSGRISYDNLRTRDPVFVDTVDRWFSHPADNGRALLVAPPPVFTSLKLRGLTLTNRVVVSPLESDVAVEGRLTEAYVEQLEALAQSGAALLLTEPTAVSAEGRITLGCGGLYDEEHIAVWQRLVEAVHAATSARVALLLNHAGRRGATRSRTDGLDRRLPDGGWPLLSASPLAYTPSGQTPRQMERADMNRVRDAFARSAEMAQVAGFDMLQLHAGHGYLLASFLSPLTNLRDDAYGGSPEKRGRFPLEVFDAVRAIWPEDRPLSVALTVADWARDGLTVDEALAFVEQLKARGCDMVEPLAGQTTPDTRPEYGPGFLTPYSDRIRHETGVMTIVRGHITTSGQMNGIVAAGQADLCLITAPARQWSEENGASSTQG